MAKVGEVSRITVQRVLVWLVSGAVLGSIACSNANQGAVFNHSGENGINSSFNASANGARQRKWHSAQIRGLEIGIASANEFISLLGPPSDRVADRDRPGDIVWLHFTVDEPFKGRLNLIVEKESKVVSSAVLAPENLSLERAIDDFKLEPQITRYAFLDCDGSESAPVRESDEGELVYYLLPEKGIAMSVDDVSKQVRFIEYLQHPPGSMKAGCD
ncbi:MAG: hypothetical protein IPM63_13490 [Acidobacteriota bacterium]|nr:MAG: hypothetical protein IPM63_13490 [Acidobacteriota bacterium]